MTPESGPQLASRRARARQRMVDFSRERLAHMREGHPGVRPVYVLPNLITSASLFSALCSIIATSNAQYVNACWLILLSAVLDALDGPVARLTRSASSFGLEYDSLADVVAFGVAPAFLMYMKLAAIDASTALPPWAPRMAIGVCALYAICGALRLARFNIQVHREEKRHFTGLPIPGAAGIIVSAFLVVEQYLPMTVLDEIELGRALHRSILVLMLIVAYLMVSTYPFPALKTLLRGSMRSMQGLITAVFVICGLLMFKNHLPLIVFGGFMAYLLGSIGAVIRDKRRLARGIVPATPSEPESPPA